MRLTQKNEFFEYVLPCQNIVGDNQATEISLGETEYTCKKYIIDEAINKLGELEDVLEKFEIENPDILALNLQTIKNINIQNTNLRNELAELKQKAIVPKYKIKQHIWLARNNVFQKEPCELIVQNIEYHFKTEDFLYIVDFVEKGHHKSIIMCDNGDLFATKEEAEQKLAEIKERKMSERSYVKNSVIYDCGFPKSLQEISDIINNLEDITTKWQHKSEDESKQIADLQHRLEVAEKALELACKYNIPDDEHSHITLRFSDTGVQVESWQELKEYALKQAKKEIKGE